MLLTVAAEERRRNFFQLLSDHPSPHVGVHGFQTGSKRAFSFAKASVTD